MEIPPGVPSRVPLGDIFEIHSHISLRVTSVIALGAFSRTPHGGVSSGISAGFSSGIHSGTSSGISPGTPTRIPPRVPAQVLP